LSFLLNNSKKLTDCAGHFGFIKLELPVFHVGYFRHTVILLQCICKNCARVLISNEDRISFLKKLRGPKIDALLRGGIFKKIVEMCKRTSRCPHCFYANGIILFMRNFIVF
jgi:DNA-directed RNA polymerase III subunit RPC1